MSFVRDLLALARLKVQRNYHVFRAMSNGPDQEQSNGYINMNQDFSVSEGRFICAPEENEIIALSRILVNIRDSGSFDSGSYGNGITLTNGIKLFVNGTALPPDTVDLTPIPIKRTTDWQTYAHDLIISTFGSGDEVASVRWTFSKSGMPMILDGAQGHRFECVITDNLSGLEHQYIMCQGLKVLRWGTV